MRCWLIEAPGTGVPNLMDLTIRSQTKWFALFLVTMGLSSGCVTWGTGPKYLAFRVPRRDVVSGKGQAAIARDASGERQSGDGLDTDRAVGDVRRRPLSFTTQTEPKDQPRAPMDDAPIDSAARRHLTLTPRRGRGEGTGGDIRQVGAEDVEVNLPAPTPVVHELAAMTLADLEDRAARNNPTLSQAQAAVAGAQGVYVQAGLYPNPQVGYLNSTSKPSIKQSNGIFFSQEFVTANKLGFAQQAASEEMKRYQWDHEAQRMRVMNDLKIRYYEVLGAQESVEVHRRLLEVSEKSLAVAESLLASEGTRTDFLQAKVQLETVRLNLEEAELRYVASWEQLAAMIGEPGMRPVPLVGDLSGEVTPLELEACWQQLLSYSPQLRAAESELGHGWATYREAQAFAVPNITVQTVADYDQAVEAATVSTLVALPLPIFNRNQGNIDKAAADIRADQEDICRIQLVLRDQLADSFRRYQTSLRQTQRLKESILPSAEENLALCQQLFARGQTAFAPVLAAQQSYFKSKVAYVEALTELNKVVTEIEGLQLTGGLNPAAIGSAIQIQAGGGAQRQRALLNELQENNSKQLLPAAQIGR